MLTETTALIESRLILLMVTTILVESKLILLMKVGSVGGACCVPSSRSKLQRSPAVHLKEGNVWLYPYCAVRLRLLLRERLRMQHISCFIILFFLLQYYMRCESTCEVFAVSLFELLRSGQVKDLSGVTAS